MTAVDYFNLIFPGEQMEFWFSVSYMSADFIGLLAMLRWGARFSFRVRIVPGFILFLGVTGAFYFVHNKCKSATPRIIFLLHCMFISDYRCLSNLQSLSLSSLLSGDVATVDVSLVLMAVLGLTEAVLTGSAFALAGHFPARYTTACMSGVGAAGVIVSGLRNITKGVMAQSESTVGRESTLISCL